MARFPRADTAAMRQHWSVLCDEIGVRYSGTRGEQQAADYIEKQFRRCDLANVHQQRFEFPNWDFTRCILRAGPTDKKQRTIETARPMCYSGSTTPDGVKGELVYLQTGLDLDFRQPTRGKIGLLIGSLLLADPRVKRNLLDARLKALIVVDARLPVPWTTSAGASPSWMDGYDLPTVSIAYYDAVELVKHMPAQAHLTVRARTFPATSQNVIAEIPGRDKPGEVIIVSGHHDTVWGVIGANDNASGVVFTLELARLFAKRPPRRTLRFISYGVEEKLSVGAYLYMRSLTAAQQKACRLVLNMDTAASHVGMDQALVTGNPPLRKLVERHWRRAKHPVQVVSDLTPYSDHFPLNIVGVPSVYLGRPTFGDSGWWSLHSQHDNLDNVSPAVLARTVNTAAGFLDAVANAPRLPFPPRIEPALFKRVRATGRLQFRHPWSVRQFSYNA